MRALFVTVCCLLAAVVGLAAQVRTGTLTIYYIDTEGGQSTLFVGPITCGPRITTAITSARCSSWRISSLSS